MQNVMRRRAALVPTIARMRRHLATQKQGDWTAVAARDYASHRQTFQADYARDCWRRLSSRPAVAPVVARAARAGRWVRLGRVYKGAGGSYCRIASIVGLDVSSDMVRTRGRRTRTSACATPWSILRTAARSDEGSASRSRRRRWRCTGRGRIPFLAGVFAPARAGRRISRGLAWCWVLSRRALTRSKGSRAWTWRASPPCSSAAPRLRGKALRDAGFVDVEVDERTVPATPSAAEVAAPPERRLAADPGPGHVPGRGDRRAGSRGGAGR